MPKEIFTYFGNWGCYDYHREGLFFGGRLIVIGCPVTVGNESYSVPGIKTSNECVPFDRKRRVLRDAVRRSFESRATFKKWERCCQDAISCCNAMLNSEEGTESSCPSVWDGWSCFAQSEPTIKVEQVCSPYAYSANGPRCHRKSNYLIKAFFSRSILKITAPRNALQTERGKCKLTTLTAP